MHKVRYISLWLVAIWRFGIWHTVCVCFGVVYVIQHVSVCVCLHAVLLFHFPEECRSGGQQTVDCLWVCLCVPCLDKMLAWWDFTLASSCVGMNAGMQAVEGKNKWMKLNEILCPLCVTYCGTHVQMHHFHIRASIAWLRSNHILHKLMLKCIIYPLFV